MTNQLTETQANVYAFLCERRAAGDNATIREICAEFGYSSPNAPTQILDALEKKGRIKRLRDNRSGAIRIVGPVCECCRGLGVRIDK